MVRKLTLTIVTDECSERPGIAELMDNLQEYCQEEANELIAMDAMEHGYYYSMFDKSANNVSVEADWGEVDE